MSLEEKYQEHVETCLMNGDEPLEYVEWLEETVMMVAFNLEQEVILRMRYEQASETNHCHYVKERKARERAESVLEQVTFMAKVRNFAEIWRFLVGVEVWN